MINAVPTIYSSPNHGGRRKRTLGVILHSTRSGRFTREAEYQAVINYMMQPDTVSSHRVIGIKEGQHAQIVDDDFESWHAGTDNRMWLGIEFAQPLPSDEYSAWQIETGIAVCRAWCKRYNIVPSQQTLVRHSDSAQGRRAGKSDPGEPFPYESFIERVKEQANVS